MYPTAWFELCLYPGKKQSIRGRQQENAAAFRNWARLMHKKSDTLYEDAMIAATASVHGLTVVTRNVADFKALDAKFLNPFASARG
jgi:predicted nucleic acid-binding protein